MIKCTKSLIPLFKQGIKNAIISPCGLSQQKFLKLSQLNLNNHSLYNSSTSSFSTTSSSQAENEAKTSKHSLLQNLTPKDMKNLSFYELMKTLETFNSTNESLFEKLEQAEASNLINAIEIKILKEIKTENLDMTIKQANTLIGFLGAHESGTIKLFSELELLISKLLINLQDKKEEIPIRTIGKLIFVSGFSNKFNKGYYQTINNYIDFLLAHQKEFSPQNYADFIDSLFLLAKSPGCSSSTLKTLLRKLDSQDFSKLSLEHLTNLTWTVFLKIKLLKRGVVLPAEDMEIEEVSSEINNLIKSIRTKVIEKTFTDLKTLPFSLKFRLRQIGLILDALNPKGALDDPFLSVLATLIPIKAHMKHETSLIHDDVTAILRAMELDQQVETEKGILIYPCDLYLPPDIIIEVNGPTHYVGYNHECKVKDLDGKTQMKYKTLLLFGYKVKGISYKEWYNIKGATNKMDFLRDKLFLEGL